ncbi:hypothetical protein DPMN_179014 [Dreissena polymorpha]|uniref:Uncharacterized protein n=1 Tax=Dreissena polymorpha TaxID=45954 RepID=A0A9D4EC08_DREPO|nr:hypothetical protein DPMN_179014 [Dreissena polymorpha]
MRTALQVSLKTDVDVCNRLHGELKQLSEVVQDLSDSSKKELSFVAGRKCMDKINESKAYLKQKSHNVELSIVYLANTDIEQYVCKQSGLGRIVQTPNALAVQRNPNHVFTVKTKNEYNVKIPSDSCQQSYIRAICVISYNKIIIADLNAKRVKLLDEQYNMISHCDLPIYEGGMCLISETEVAVTVIVTGNKHAIQFITESNDQLVAGRRFEVQHECKSIANYQTDLFITSYTAVYKYTLGGQLVKKLFENKSGNSTI